jgi:hypothetical protein
MTIIGPRPVLHLEKSTLLPRSRAFTPFNSLKKGLWVLQLSIANGQERDWTYHLLVRDSSVV